MTKELEDLSLELPESANQRRCYRVSVQGLTVRVHKLDRALPLADLSACGLSIQGVPEGGLGWGEVFACDLLLDGKPYIAGLFAKVRRLLAHGEAGCTFEELDRRKEARLDKLVLEIQKQDIDRNKRAEAD